MHKNTHANPNRLLKVLSKPRHFLVLIAVTGIAFVGSGSAQSTLAANTDSGTVLGRVLDANEDPVANATVVLQRAEGDHATVVTTDDGSFAFHDLTPGIAHQITVTAQGYGDWSSAVTVQPGQEKTLTDIKLRIVAMHRAVTVSYSSKEVAAQQLKAEEHQRVLGFIPNIFVTYEPHPEPLTAKMKFHLTYKGLTHPTFFAFEALWAGVEQGADITDYRLGARGFGERFGANLASGASEGLFANAILPSLLHQDPRYFYHGSGTKGSRVWHAVSAPFVCQGDNGKSQPNYSQMGGSLISAALSNTYYPLQRAVLDSYSQTSGPALASMWPSVWRRSSCWANSRAEVSTSRVKMFNSGLSCGRISRRRRGRPHVLCFNRAVKFQGVFHG